MNPKAATMQCQLLQLVEQHKLRKSGSKQNQTFFLKLLQKNMCDRERKLLPKKYVRSGKIISTKCCWRHPSSNIFMVHWPSSGRKGGICFGKWQKLGSISSGYQVRDTGRGCQQIHNTHPSTGLNVPKKIPECPLLQKQGFSRT